MMRDDYGLRVERFIQKPLQIGVVVAVDGDHAVIVPMFNVPETVYLCFQTSAIEFVVAPISPQSTADEPYVGNHKRSNFCSAA